MSASCGYILTSLPSTNNTKPTGLTSWPTASPVVEIGGFFRFDLDLSRDVVHFFGLSFDVGLEYTGVFAVASRDGRRGRTFHAGVAHCAILEKKKLGFSKLKSCNL